MGCGLGRMWDVYFLVSVLLHSYQDLDGGGSGCEVEEMLLNDHRTR